MSQSAFLTSLDAEIHAALADAGLADDAHYTAPGGVEPVPCRVYLDERTWTVGEYAPAYADAARLTILRADVPDPVEGATVTILGRTWTLRQPIDNDDGISVWEVV